MTGNFLEGIGGLITALVAVAAAGAATWRYFAHRERKAIVRTAFREVVDSLGAPDVIHRRAGAILMRRFFDETTEQGGKGTPYAKEALHVIAATLRSVESGSFQKLLADGLADSPSLRGADLQKTNLQGAYLGARPDRPVDISGADFFRADLTHASLKNATAVGAIFYQARLNNTVLRNADLRRANFYEADLLGARFDGAKLEGATFTGARNLPPEIENKLDASGIYVTNGRESSRPGPARPGVFLSRPGVANIETRQRVRALIDRIRGAGLEVVEIDRSDYARTGAVAEVRRCMAGCAGVAVVAVPDLEVESAVWRQATPQAREVANVGLTSPWTNLELGMAAGLGLPVLLAIADGLDPAVFDYSPHEPNVYPVALEQDHLSRSFREPFDDWCGSVREQAAVVR